MSGGMGCITLLGEGDAEKRKEVLVAVPGNESQILKRQWYNGWKKGGDPPRR